MAKTSVNHIDFYYERHGQGTPLILICGFMNHLGMWKHFIPPLSKHFEVIVFDNRGAGRTETTAPPYTIQQLADDTVKLMDTLKISKAHIAGFSMGSAIVQSICYRYPQKVLKGILIAPFSILPSTALMQMHSFAKLFDAGVEPALALETILPWIYSNQFLSDPKNIENVISEMLNNPYPQSPKGFLGQLEALSSYDLSPQLHEIQTPILLLAGEEDLYTPFYETKRLNETLPNSSLRSFPKVGHMPHLEVANLVIKEIHAFCSS